MGHNSNTGSEPGSRTFKAYLDPRAGWDVQRAYLEPPPADAILKAFAYKGIDCDLRTPCKMPDDDNEFDNLPLDDEIVELE